MGELIAALVMLMAPQADQCDAVEALDVVRAAAWVAGDESALVGVYATGAGHPDAQRLRSWRDRGIGVRGMRMVRERCRPLGATSVQVVERLGPTVAVLSDGSRRALPQDAWDRRVIELRWQDGRWRIGAVA